MVYVCFLSYAVCPGVWGEFVRVWWAPVIHAVAFGYCRYGKLGGKGAAFSPSVTVAIQAIQ